MYDIGIIGAMADEVAGITARLNGRQTELVSGIEFNTGILFGKRVVVARCGIGKVFAAICAEAMILKYKPKLVVNTGVGGALDKGLLPLDMVFATGLVQHDMDTSALGDPIGMVSGINKVYFPTDPIAVSVLTSAADELGIRYTLGTIASGDKFVADAKEKAAIAETFSAISCEMEGAAIAHTAYINNTHCIVLRAISDSLEGNASMEYSAFLPKAAEISTKLTLALIEKY